MLNSSEVEISIEIDPRVTSDEHLKLLKELGFSRVSLGVQDFNRPVQESVNRIQSYELVEGMVNYCRELGFESVNFDLIYGLPLQNLESFTETVEKVIKLSPDRIALFNYAHLPSMRPFQKAYINELELPSRDTKLLIFAEAMKQLCANGYEYIGMDHFAKNTDELALAKKDRSLHRNFQGYTTKAGCDLFGLGMTSISNIAGTYSQNEKKLNKYLEFFNDKYDPITLVPIEKGYICTEEDKLRQTIISRLLCHGYLSFKEIEDEYKLGFKDHFVNELTELQAFDEDGLVLLRNDCIEVTSMGQIFLRNIGMVFDTYLGKTQNKLFSRTI